MRLALFLLLSPTFVSVIVGGVVGGNRVAEGVAIGFMLPVCLVVALIAAPRPRPLPRKADPAKIARMEADLGIGDAGERAAQSRERHGCIDPDCPHEHYQVGGFGPRMHLDASEASTTPFEHPIVDTAAVPESAHQFLGVKPPAVRSVEDCPRPEGCVMAHPCRKCGAERGYACVGDPFLPGPPIVR